MIIVAFFFFSCSKKLIVENQKDHLMLIEKVINENYFKEYNFSNITYYDNYVFQDLPYQDSLNLVDISNPFDSTLKTFSDTLGILKNLKPVKSSNFKDLLSMKKDETHVRYAPCLFNEKTQVYNLHIHALRCLSEKKEFYYFVKDVRFKIVNGKIKFLGLRNDMKSYATTIHI